MLTRLFANPFWIWIQKPVILSQKLALFFVGDIMKIFWNWNYPSCWLDVRFSCAGSIVRLKLSCESLTSLKFKSYCFYCFKLKPRRYNEAQLYRTIFFGPFRVRYIRVLPHCRRTSILLMTLNIKCWDFPIFSLFKLTNITVFWHMPYVLNRKSPK